MTFDPTTNRIEELYQAAKRDAEEAEAYAEELEEELREARMQSLSDLGQAQDAYKAQLVAETKLAKAVEALAYIDGMICWELNLSNYDHQSVCEMNADWCAVGTRAADTLATLKGQSGEHKTIAADRGTWTPWTK